MVRDITTDGEVLPNSTGLAMIINESRWQSLTNADGTLSEGAKAAIDELVALCYSMRAWLCINWSRDGSWIKIQVKVGSYGHSHWCSNVAPLGWSIVQVRRKTLSGTYSDCLPVPHRG